MTDANTLADIFLAMGDRLAQAENRVNYLENQLENKEGEKRIQIDRAISAERLSNQYSEKIRILEKTIHDNHHNEKVVNFETIDNRCKHQAREIQRLESIIASKDNSLHVNNMANESPQTIE